VGCAVAGSRPVRGSMVVGWLSSRRQAWLRPPSAAGGAALGAGELGGIALGGAENGKLNCASAGAVQRKRAGNARASPCRAVAIALPIMEAGPVMAIPPVPSVKPPRENRGDFVSKTLAGAGPVSRRRGELVMENGRGYGGDEADCRGVRAAAMGRRFSPGAPSPGARSERGRGLG